MATYVGFLVDWFFIGNLLLHLGLGDFGQVRTASFFLCQVDDGKRIHLGQAQKCCEGL